MNSTITQVRRTLRRKVRHPRGRSLKYHNGCRPVLRASFVGSVIEATSRSEYTKVGRNRALRCFCSVVLWVCLTACVGFRRFVLIMILLSDNTTYKKKSHHSSCIFTFTDHLRQERCFILVTVTEHQCNECGRSFTQESSLRHHETNRRKTGKCHSLNVSNCMLA